MSDDHGNVVDRNGPSRRGSRSPCRQYYTSGLRSPPVTVSRGNALQSVAGGFELLRSRDAANAVAHLINGKDTPRVCVGVRERM
jgi:hypothetical protein